MSHPQFEAVKVALKQDKTGYILTLNIHPDDLDERILRDFVGARYQVVMVRINGEEKPMNRDQDLPRDIVQLAGILSADTRFHDWLVSLGFIPEANTKAATEWLRSELGVLSRTELKTNPEASQTLLNLNEEFKAWKRNG
jgi:hypothetical protein